MKFPFNHILQMKWLVIISLALSMGELCLGSPDASSWSQPRNFFEPFNESFSSKVVVEQIPLNSLEPESALLFSSNEVYWCVLKQKESPTDQAHLTVFADKKYLNRIEIKDSYINFPVRAEWVGEKLIYIQVWWGRILGTQYIYDVENHNFIHREMVVDGTALYQQTQMAQTRKLPRFVSSWEGNFVLDEDRAGVVNIEGHPLLKLHIYSLPDRSWKESPTLIAMTNQEGEVLYLGEPNPKGNQPVLDKYVVSLHENIARILISYRYPGNGNLKLVQEFEYTGGSLAVPKETIYYGKHQQVWSSKNDPLEW